MLHLISQFPATLGRNTSGLRIGLGYWMLMAIALTVGRAESARGSCGDYLHDRMSLSIAINSSKVLPNIPSDHMPNCKDGKCGSQIPVPLPVRDKVQVEERLSGLDLVRHRFEFGLKAARFGGEADQKSIDIYLEVSVPPPRAN